MKNYYKKYARVYIGIQGSQFTGISKAYRTVDHGGKSLYLTYCNEPIEVNRWVRDELRKHPTWYPPPNLEHLEAYAPDGEFLDADCIERVQRWMEAHKDEERTDMCDVIIETASPGKVLVTHIKNTPGYQVLRVFAKQYGMDIYLYNVACTDK